MAWYLNIDKSQKSCKWYFELKQLKNSCGELCMYIMVCYGIPEYVRWVAGQPASTTRTWDVVDTTPQACCSIWHSDSIEPMHQSVYIPKGGNLMDSDRA